ncbi:uncharacterized protein LOC130589892 [Beta vulgaris subsp. vulgaris]|uniref:uncharacterized protein LOC130589892 n=1 Tax=Beta vulgaris subsp. vulgaris TaxID=3555 RepID=UPI002549182B|nr:uncharacterized protein LOC130589892 [Beta vulgaris subsp. vulgaris]
MDRLKNRKRSAASSGQSQIERVPRKNLRSSSIPTTIDITTDSPRDEVLVSFPADFLAEEGLEGGIWPAADKLVFPAAQKRLKGQDPEVILNHAVQLSLQLSQSCIAARDSLRTVATLQDKVARLQKDNLSHQAKLEREKQSRLDAESKLAAEQKLMEKERLEKDEKIAEAEKENARLAAAVREAEERALDIQAEAKIIETAKLAFLIKFKKLDDKGVNFYIDRFLKLDSMTALEALATGGKTNDSEKSTAESPPSLNQPEGAVLGDKDKVAGDDASVIS